VIQKSLKSLNWRSRQNYNKFCPSIHNVKQYDAVTIDACDVRVLKFGARTQLFGRIYNDYEQIFYLKNTKYLATFCILNAFAKIHFFSNQKYFVFW